jgi:HPt (histidine-containing phosphotransfer) domain-containing protein
MIGCPKAARPVSQAASMGPAMSIPPPTDPMQSPPLAPGGDPIDIEHLRRMTLDDPALEREVLAMFLRQTDELIGALLARPEQGVALAHTLKGSACAIGAFDVAANAGAVEDAIRHGADASPAITTLETAIAEARVLIRQILERA